MLRTNWHYPFGTACLAIAALMIAYNIWVQYDIPKEVPSSIELLQVGVVRLPCSKEHFWGNVVLYRRDDRPDKDDHWGRACRDWIGQKWIFNTN